MATTAGWDMSRQTNMRTGRVLALAVAAVMPMMALGQYQTGNSTGRLLDANNRLGSAGINDPNQTPGGVSPNDIVYGNVTRGQQFRGSVSKDPTAFRANLDRPSDNLVRDAGPSVYQEGGVNDMYRAQRFYGDNRGVRPPEGFGQLTPGSVGGFRVVQPTYRVPGDLRMDDAIPNPDLSLARPPQYIIPGATVMTELGTTMSPMGDQMPTVDTGLMPSRDLLRRLNLDETRIRAMRDELRKSAAAQSNGEETPANPDDLTIAPETPTNNALDSSMNSDVAAQSVSGSINTQQSMRQQLLTATPSAARQSEQYAELTRRLDRFNKRKAMTDEEASQQFLKDWQAAQDKDKQKQEQAKDQAARTPEQPQQPAAPSKLPDATDEETANNGTVDRRRMAIRQQAEGGEKVEGVLPPQPDIPMKISSFADGVKATGLKNLLLDAEKAMQAGKFTQALDYYDGAASVAPNNPLIMVARSIAELGAGYYARAQIHLEQALSMDPALLMARYDLKAFYGEDRLTYIARDLKDLAQAEMRQSRPLFLLAFIAYSTDSQQRAADYLDLAQQRGGSKEFYDKLREYWKLNPEAKTGGPAAAPAPVPTAPPALNK